MKSISEPKAHAKYSASGSDRWLNCPGSLALSENAPPQRESEYALEGTKAHECLELILKTFPMMNLKKLENTFSSEMIDHAWGSAQWIRNRLQEGSHLLSETKVDASPFTCPDQFGTLDAAIVEEFGTLTVIDYKYGAGIAVDPKENTQMIYYALALSHQYHHNFQRVELVIIQPRAYHEEGPIRTWSLSMEELLSWVPKFKKGVEATNDLFAPLNAGTWCKFCPAATICPEIKNRSLKQAQIVFNDLEEVESVPDPKSIAIENLPAILKATYTIEAWIDKVREHALHVLERGEKVPGFKLVDKRSIRKWNDVLVNGEQALVAFGSDAFTPPELLSPAQLEKIAGKDWVNARTTSQSSGVTLVPESDRRPAVNLIEAAFSELDQNGKEIEMAKKTKKKPKKKASK